jgi:hypothetical protein
VLSKPTDRFGQLDERTQKAARRFLGLSENASVDETQAAISKLDERAVEEFHLRFVEPFEPPWRHVICFVEDHKAWADVTAVKAGDLRLDSAADAIVPAPEDGHDPDFDGPLVVELRREPRQNRPLDTVRVERPVKQDVVYRRHVRRLNRAPYSEVLRELKLVASPRKGKVPPSPLEFYKYDWLLLVPYAREFIRQTRQILGHAVAKRPVSRVKLLDDRHRPENSWHYWVSLASEAAPIIDKMLVRGADAKRGRPRAPRPDQAVVTALRAEAQETRAAVKAIALQLTESEDEVAAKRDFLKLLSELGVASQAHSRAAHKLLKAKRGDAGLRLVQRPQRIVNTLLAWKHGLRPSDVGRYIAQRPDRRRRQ